MQIHNALLPLWLLTLCSVSLSLSFLCSFIYAYIYVYVYSFVRWFWFRLFWLLLASYARFGYLHLNGRQTYMHTQTVWNDTDGCCCRSFDTYSISNIECSPKQFWTNTIQTIVLAISQAKRCFHSLTRFFIWLWPLSLSFTPSSFLSHSLCWKPTHSHGTITLQRWWLSISI